MICEQGDIINNCLWPAYNFTKEGKYTQIIKTLLSSNIWAFAFCSDYYQDSNTPMRNKAQIHNEITFN